MKYLKSILSIILVILIFATIFAVPASADSYTHWYTKGSKKSVTLRDVYETKTELDGSSLGLSHTLEGLNDLYTYNDNLYVLAGDSAKVLILNKDYKVVSELAVTDKDGNKIDFLGARGIFVDDKGIIIADTAHARVLILNPNGVLERTITLPDSSIIPKTYIYKPTKVLRDLKGYTYILSEGSYYGALLFDDKYEFLGFYGANTTKSSITDIISNLWEKFFTTDVQKGKQTKALPYQFSNFCLAKDGFLYTSTGSTSLWVLGTGQVIKLSPGAVNVLYKYDNKGEATPVTSFNFSELTYLNRNNYNCMQDFRDLYVDENDFIYTIDKTYGIIYIYDSRCNLISAFGGGFGEGDRIGQFCEPTAITKFGNDIVVSDILKKTITVFSLTDFGSRLISAQKLTIDGDFKEASGMWEKIITEEPNCQMAYSGLANYCLESGDYQRGLKLAKDGCDLSTYSEIYEKVSKNFLRRNMGYIFGAAAVIIILSVVLGILYKKKHRGEEKAVSERKERLMLPLKMLLHPFDSFVELKYKDKGSVKIAFVIAIIYYVLDVIASVNGGFLFTSFENGEFNALFTLAKTSGLILLWSVANWGICSILQGKGRLKDIFCVTTYAIIPLIAERLIFIILSNLLPISASVFLSGVSTVALIYFAFLLISGMLIIHDYSLKKFIGTTILTILGMILVVFIAFVLAIFIQQLFNFAVSVYTEIAYR